MATSDRVNGAEYRLRRTLEAHGRDCVRALTSEQPFGLSRVNAQAGWTGRLILRRIDTPDEVAFSLTGAPNETILADLLAMTMSELRRLLWRRVWARTPRLDTVLRRPDWA